MVTNRLSNTIQLSVVVALLCIGVLAACTGATEEEIAPNTETFLPGSVGIIDESGEWIIKPRFDALSDFSDNGLAKAWDVNTGKQGFINWQGEWVIEPFFENSIEKRQDYLLLKGKNGWGTVDKEGKWLTSEDCFVEVTGTEDNLVAGCKVEGLWGFADLEGEWVIEPVLKEVGYFNKNGYATALSYDTGLEGVIDLTGTWVVEPRYLSVKGVISSNGLASVQDTVTELYGVIDEDENWVIEPVFKWMSSFGEKHYAQAQIP